MPSNAEENLVCAPGGVAYLLWLMCPQLLKSKREVFYYKDLFGYWDKRVGIGLGMG
jgi:hypothetical protein